MHNKCKNGVEDITQNHTKSLFKIYKTAKIGRVLSLFVNFTKCKCGGIGGDSINLEI